MHTVETGYVTPKYSAWERSPLGLKTCDLRYRFWEGVTLKIVDT